MPKPLVCLSEQLRQFAEYFRPCFSQRQWRYFVIVLLDHELSPGDGFSASSNYRPSLTF